MQADGTLWTDAALVAVLPWLIPAGVASLTGYGAWGIFFAALLPATVLAGVLVEAGWSLGARERFARALKRRITVARQLLGQRGGVTREEYEQWVTETGQTLSRYFDADYGQDRLECFERAGRAQTFAAHVAERSSRRCLRRQVGVL